MARDADPFTSIMIGEPFDVAEVSLGDVLSGLGSYTAVVNDPPWTLIAPAFPKPARVIVAADMELSELEALAAVGDAGRTVVGIGGGTAMDTAPPSTPPSRMRSACARTSGCATSPRSHRVWWSSTCP
jgi:glycerol dehydrogenase-like iron-containing ADH family enzyme